MFEPSHEIMAHFVLRNLILQTHMRSHPVGLDVLIFGRTLRLLPFFMCANSEGSGETAQTLWIYLHQQRLIDENAYMYMESNLDTCSLFWLQLTDNLSPWKCRMQLEWMPSDTKRVFLKQHVTLKGVCPRAHKFCLGPQSRYRGKGTDCLGTYYLNTRSCGWGAYWKEATVGESSSWECVWIVISGWTKMKVQNFT